MKYSLLFGFLCFGWCGSLGTIQADPITYTVTPFDVPGSKSTNALGINKSGQIVGSYTDSAGVEHGFLDTNGAFTTLPFVATGINNVGQIVGLSNTGIILDTNGAISNIAIPGFGSVPGYIGDRLAKINDLGQIVGNYHDPQAGDLGFLYANGAVMIFPIADDQTVTTHGINNASQIVLTVQGFGNPATLLYQNGQYFSVPGLESINVAYAGAINNVGQIVAYNPPDVDVVTNGVVSGFVFVLPDMSRGGIPFDVNDAGVIVGGNVIATPVPEPGSLLLLLLLAGGLGLAGLVVAWRRIRNRANMILRFCFVFGLLLGGRSLATADILYSVTDLGALPGGYFSQGSDINNLGQVTGFAGTASSPFGNPNTHAFLYSNGQMQDLGALGGSDSYGTAINNRGQVTGYFNASSSGVAYHAFLYSNGQMQDIGADMGLGINDLGQVTGVSPFAGASDPHAFLYSNGQLQDLGTLGGRSGGNSINNAGQVTGYSSLTPQLDSNFHAFLYSNGQFRDLNASGGSLTSGNAINNAGQITGSLTASDGDFHAFLYSNGQAQDLGTLTGDRKSVGYGINNAGQVVGLSEVASTSDSRAFLYSNGQIYDLNTLIDPSLHLSLYEATAINDNGQIVANTGSHAYLLAPVPEPGTWALFGLALLWLGAEGRRRPKFPE